jgi:hypothetical protein
MPLQSIPVTLYVDGCAAMPPPAPAVTISRGAGDSAVLTWTPEPGQAAYRLYRGGEPYAEVLWRELAGGTKTASDLVPGRAAFYWMEAGNCSGDWWAGSNRVGWMVFSLYNR